MFGGVLSVIRKRKVINFVDGLKRKLGKIDVFGKLCAVDKLCLVGMFGTFDMPTKKTYIPE